MQSKSFLAASLLAASVATSFATTADAAIVVNIDKTTQQMSVSVDGTARYVWPVSTGRPGYDTPNGIFKANRMDADHLSQEWDNAPMPHTIFFDVRGHAVHGFFDVKHLGLPVSHGCVRLSPAHAATLFNLVTAEGMNQTTIVVSGHTPAGSLELGSRRAPVEQASTQPVESASVTVRGAWGPTTRKHTTASRSPTMGKDSKLTPRSRSVTPSDSSRPTTRRTLLWSTSCSDYLVRIERLLGRGRLCQYRSVWFSFNRRPACKFQAARSLHRAA